MSALAEQFRATGSIVERCDARAKVVAACAAIVAVVAADGVVAKAAVVVLLLICWLAARAGVRALLLLSVSMGFFFLTTMVLRGVIRGRGAPDLIAVGPVQVSASGAVDGAQMCLQALGIVMALVLLTRTTPAVPLSEGLERLFAPAQRLGMPIHDGVMMFSIALRFLPVTARELARLQVAQSARGGRGGSIRHRLRAVVPLVLPLIVVSLLRAKELAEAMESRGYRGAEGRTPIREQRLGGPGVTVIVGSSVVVAAAVASRLAYL